MTEDNRYRRNDYDGPYGGDGDQRVSFGPDRHGRYRMDDGQEPVQRHEHQRVNRSVRSHYNEILDGLTPQVAEIPVREDVIGGRERHAEDDEKEIGHGQIDYEQVGGGPHLLVGGHHYYHQSVAEEADHYGYAEQDHHDDDDYLVDGRSRVRPGPDVGPVERNHREVGLGHAAGR